MSVQVGNELLSLFEDNSYIVGAHRSGYTRIFDEDEKRYKENLSNYFDNGFINNEGINYGVANHKNEAIDTEKTVSYTRDIAYLTAIVKTSEGYKHSDGTFVVVIPKSYLGLGEG